MTAESLSAAVKFLCQCADVRYGRHGVRYVADPGRKWTRIVRERLNTATGEVVERSASMFVGTDGQIRPSASWKAPATYSTGSIFAANFGGALD